MLHLNGIVFSNPKCTYSSESLANELIYVPSRDPLEIDHLQSLVHIPCILMDDAEPLLDGDQADFEERPVIRTKGKLLIYFHGNAEDLGIVYTQLQVFKDALDLRVLAMEYRGYGLYGS